jgi:membrane associated rhomboid family serine protease
MEAKRELVVCPNCDALKSIDQVVCPVCGVSSTQIPINIQEDETQSFLRAILTRPANFTILLLFANVAVFILMSASGGSTNAEVLRAYGAKYNSLIVEEGQWWRFITPIFIHIGAIHLLSNMYGLWILGQYVERLYGSKKFVFFWVATGIAGVVGVSLSWR